MISAMPVYITLMKWTSQGLGGIPAWRDRVEEAERAIQQRGGRLVDAYGQVTTETLRGFSREEAENIVRGS
jgi:uncharacterized protein with GYD domain